MILTVTPNPALDHTLRLDDRLEPGAIARTDDAQFDAGGKGINVSMYLQAMDVDTVATGFLGGHIGEFLRDDLADSGVPPDFVRVDGETRLNTTVLAPEGEYKINQNGPRVVDSDIDDLVSRVREHDPDLVLVAGSYPPGFTTDTVDRLADAGGWDVVVDFGGETLRELDARYALAKPNREELHAATGMPVGTIQECVDAARSLRERGFDRVVASLGADGAILVSGGNEIHVPAQDIDVVDTVGAGDALLSGVLAALDHGVSEDAALRFGVTVASRVTGVPGTSVPDLADVAEELDGLQASSS